MLHGPRWKSSAAIYRDEGEEIERVGMQRQGHTNKYVYVDANRVTIIDVIKGSGLPMATNHMQPKHQM